MTRSTLHIPAQRGPLTWSPLVTGGLACGSVENYIRKCDSCQRRNEEWVCGAVRKNGAFIPFRSQSMDITGPYLVTPRKNKYLLTFIDQFSKWVEAYPIPDVAAETCARVYSSQILTRHGTGSTLITDKGRSFSPHSLRKRAKYWESGK
jgi:hypothetical protein